MAIAYVGLGANLGDTQKNIASAIERINALGAIIAVSSLYQTEPVGYEDQDWFLNCVLKLDTTLTARELLEALQEIERDLGKKITIRWGPRTIDLDILLYDNQVFDVWDLQVPHPRLHVRAFVLVPLAEIAPEAIHPVIGKTMRELKNELTSSKQVEKL